MNHKLKTANLKLVLGGRNVECESSAVDHEIRKNHNNHKETENIKFLNRTSF